MIHHRRDFVLQGTALALLGGCQTPPPQRVLSSESVTAAQLPGADVHCHIFNASDVPVKGFVQRVVLRDYEPQTTSGADALERASFSGLAGVLVRFLSRRTVTATREFELLHTGSERVNDGFDPVGPVAVNDLAEALRATLNERAAQLDERLDGQDPLAVQIEREIGLSPDGGDERSGGPGGGGDRVIAQRLLGSDGFLGRNLRWSSLLRGPRKALLDELLRLYSVEGDIRLFAPALVDFTHWLDNEEPRSDLASQIIVMEALQEYAARTRQVAVHAFAPFDPWRQIVAEEKRFETTPLDLLMDAVEKRGFLGVKLYPPMGFLPDGNARAGLSYPSRSIAIENFPAKLDRALHKLYSWAARNGIAIMAHAMNSQGANQEYGRRAHPKGWASVAARYPELRINLAHFGQFTDESSDSFEGAAGKLIADRSANVFVDISYFAHALPAKHDANMLSRVREKFTGFIERYDPDMRRILYGSDWSMLGREKQHQKSLVRTKAFIAELGGAGAWTRVTRGNPGRYLGLARGELARARLDAWRLAKGLGAFPSGKAMV